MAYQVIRKFADAEDGGRLYEPSFPYPYEEGVAVSDDRIDYLLNKGNDFEEPFIKVVPDAPAAEETEQEIFPKHVGGGTYELSNGEKVKGKEAAIKAQQALKAGE